MIAKQELIDFETDIAECFNKKLIKAPIHLYSGNEDAMIRVFEKVSADDWVLCTWRNHYQCLLKGVPKDLLKQNIINVKAMSMCLPKYKIV